MSDTWTSLSEVDFSDQNLNQFHVDTRDFCISTSGDPRPNNYRLVRNHPERYVHTAEEVLAMLNRMFEESGGIREWRMLSLDGSAKKFSINWQYKYFRIYRVNGGLIVCDMYNLPQTKEHLSCPVFQRYL